MNFKEFFILQERKYFIDVAKFTEHVIHVLEQKIRKKKNGVKSGDKITVPFGDYFDLDIKFYKGYSRRAQEQRRLQNWGDEGVKAFYYPETADSNGTIEIYFNTSKSKDYYYKDKNFEDVINHTLPKFIKDALRHELAHAYEDIVTDKLKFKNASYEKSVEQGPEGYYNSDDELNAYLSQFLTSELSINPDILSKIQEGDINGAVNSFIRKLKLQDFIKQVKPENKIWIIKTIYTFVQDLVEKSKAKLPS